MVAAIGWQVAKLARPREYELKSATITKLNTATRSGEIEFIHPKSGRTQKVSAQHIPEDCEVLINGQPAELSDVQVGDTVAVRGLVYPDYTVEPRWVRVTRQAPQSQPAATQPATPDSP